MAVADFWWETTEIDPQIKLVYPLNDVTKAGLVPIIWSVDTLNNALFYNYSTFRFDLYFETATLTKTLIVSDYNPLDIIYERKLDQLTHDNPLFHSLLTHYSSGIDPLGIGYEFDAEIIFKDVGTGSSISEEELEVIYFTIEETTTNTTISASLNFRVGSDDPTLIPAQSDGIQIMSAYAAIIPDETKENTLTQTQYHTPFDIVPYPLGIICSLVSLRAIYSKKRK